MTKSAWKYLLINGKPNFVKVENPVFKDRILTSITGLDPFHGKSADGTPIEPTVLDAERIKRAMYAEFFKKTFKNLLILSGAGSSMDVGGFSMRRLWDEVATQYRTPNEDGLQLILEKVQYPSQKKDLEGLLSTLDLYCKFNDDDIAFEAGIKKISKIRAEILAIIKDKCTLPHPGTKFPHRILLEKLLQRKQTNPRIKVFTLNYDLLFEFAAIDVNAIVVDGFSFTFPRTFSGRFFDYDIVQREGSKIKDEDNFIQRVFHLHKLHGSLNWERNAQTGAIIEKNQPSFPLIIYPRESKYEDSYEQPFFEMMARFQRSLRFINDTLLICIGYSFNDKHVNAAIEEALNQNPSFRLAIIDPEFEDESISNSLNEIKRFATDSERVIIIAETFSDFAEHFPEIKTYENDNYNVINLKNDRPKD